jgi:lysophospholipase L1-like esterase
VSRKSRAKQVERAAVETAASTSPEPSRRRRLVMWAIVLLLPFVLVGGAEFVLRIAGLGHDLEPLFIPSPQQPGYLQANPRAVTRFFTDPAQAPSVSIETAYFAARKAPGTFRVFVQGESSAAGFPYGLGASLAGVLDRRLEFAFPEREIEVISTAMSAVNSYALLDFADEIIAQQPDAVIVYVGHNEYLGILGVGSSMRMASTPRTTRAFLAVRELRLFQLISVLYRKLASAPGTPSADSGDSLMARVAGERSIPLDSTLYRRGLEQFQSNLGELLEKYRRAGIPVFVGTLVSNERDQMPLAILSAAQSDSTGAAQTAYLAAQDAETAEDFESAGQGYAWARDLDPLRFRAPSEFNAIVASTAATHGAGFVDVHKAFVGASPHGLVGSTLLLEHVHPNLDGYLLLADAFYDGLIESGLPGRPGVRVSRDEDRAWMPVSDVDRWFGEYKVRKIRSTWPFAVGGTSFQFPPAASEAERIAQDLYQERIGWPDAQDRLRQYYRTSGDKQGYARVTAILGDAFPFAGQLQFETAAALIDVGRPAAALRYARRAAEIEPRNVSALLVQAHALLLLDRRAAGRTLLEQVLLLEPGNATARDAMKELDGN